MKECSSQGISAPPSQEVPAVMIGRETPYDHHYVDKVEIGNFSKPLCLGEVVFLTPTHAAPLIRVMKKENSCLNRHLEVGRGGIPVM